MSPYAYLPMLTHLVCHHTLTYQSSLVWRRRTRSARATADLGAGAIGALRAAIASLRFQTHDDTLLLSEVLGRPLSGGAAGGSAAGGVEKARRLPPFAALLASGVRSMRLASGDRARSTAARQRHETTLFRTLISVAGRHEIGAFIFLTVTFCAKTADNLTHSP